MDILFNPELRSELWDIFVKRGLPSLAGVALILIGVAFVLSGTKAAQVAGGLVDLVATKGAGKIGRAVT